MDQISLTELRKHLFQTFDIMKDTSYRFKIAYKGEIYIMHVERTGQKAEVRPRFRKQDLVEVEVIACPLCDSPMVQGICTNTRCENS